MASTTSGRTVRASGTRKRGTRTTGAVSARKGAASSASMRGIDDDLAMLDGDEAEDDLDTMYGDETVGGDAGEKHERETGLRWTHLSVADQAYVLRLRELPLRQIADLLEIDVETARRYVRQVEREVAPRRKEARERLLQHSVRRIRGLAIEAAAHYDRTHEASVLTTRLRCEIEIAKLQGLYSLARELVKHERSDADIGLVPVRFFDPSAAIATLTEGSEDDSDGGESPPGYRAGDGAALGQDNARRVVAL